MTEIKENSSLAEKISVEVVSSETGEVKELNATPVLVIDKVVKFKTNYTDNTKTLDCEVNVKPYEIDDSMYVPLRDLLKMAEKQKIPLKLVETFDGLDDKEVIETISKDGTDVSVVSSNEEIASNEPTVQSQGELNQAISEPDVGTTISE